MGRVPPITAREPTRCDHAHPQCCLVTSSRSPSPDMFDGSSLHPLEGGPPKQIVLLLHGHGSHGGELISLASQWRQSLPGALFLAPNAPQRCGAVGYQWWPLLDFADDELAAGTKGAAPAINTFIDANLAQYGLQEKDLALVGFSQGTMLALHVGLRRKPRVAGILGYSGMLTGAPELAQQQTSKPPVFLIHGSEDPIVPVVELHTAEQELRRAGVQVATHVSVGAGHAVDAEGARLGVEFVSKVLLGSE
jgi:phospholipase/carboxylesterase